MSPSTTTLSGEASEVVSGVRAQDWSSLVGIEDQRRMFCIGSKELPG